MNGAQASLLRVQVLHSERLFRIKKGVYDSEVLAGREMQSATLKVALG